MRTVSMVLLSNLIFSAASLQSQTALPKSRVAGQHHGTVPQVALSDQLDKLYATATKFTTFRKITCEESIHSEQNSIGFSRPVHWRLDTRGEFTVMRSSTGEAGLQDSHRYLTKDGNPITPVTSIPFPYLLTDIFEAAIPSFLAPEHRACRHFSINNNRLDFETVSSMAGHGPCADVPPGGKGFAVFDRVTETISHLERTVPLQASLAGSFAPFAAVDYTPYGFMGRLIMIPAHIVARKRTESLTYSFEGTYTSCRLFQPTVTLYDADGKVISQPSKQ